MVEKMRHLRPKPAVHERVCPFCPDHVEDELHFLLICNTFQVNREILLSLANNALVGFQQLSHEQQLIKLTGDSRTIKATSKYLRNSFEVREFLLKHHKGPG